MRYLVWNIDHEAPVRFELFGLHNVPVHRAAEATVFPNEADAAHRAALADNSAALEAMPVGEAKLRMAGMSFL